MSSKRKPKSRGHRYTDDEKAQAVASVHEYNRVNGRGGITHVAKEMGCTQLTIRSWLDRPAVVNPGLSVSAIAIELEAAESKVRSLRAELQRRLEATKPS